eukprot:889792_1
MSRKKIATLMLIAIVIHAAGALDAKKVCKAPTITNVFEGLSERYTYSSDLLNDKRTDCNTGGKWCSTTIDCAKGYGKSKAIKLWCKPRKGVKSQWSLSEKCISKVLNLKCKFTAGSTIKCDWTNYIQATVKVQYLLELWDYTKIGDRSSTSTAHVGTKYSNTGARGHGTFDFTKSRYAISTNKAYRAILSAFVLWDNGAFGELVRFPTQTDVLLLNG